MTDTKPGRLSIGIIGSGKVGPVLALALAGAGHHLNAITASSYSAKERIAAMLPQLEIKETAELVRSSQLVIFAIPGSELERSISGLTAANAWQPGQLVLHTAPEYGYTIFNPALAAGVIPLALSPALEFTGTSLDLARLQESRCVISAPAPVLPIAQALAVEIGTEPVVIADADRAEYAEILAFAKDICRAVTQQTNRRIKALGVAEPGALSASIISSSISEALRVWAEPNYDSAAAELAE